MIAKGKSGLALLALLSMIVMSGCSEDKAGHTNATENPGRDVAAHEQSAVDASDPIPGGDQDASADGPISTIARQTSEPSGPKYMPIEATYLTDGAVNERATDMLESPDFDKLLDAFDAQNAGGRNELASAYRVAIEETLSTVSAPKRLERVVCATEMCFATLRTSEATWFSGWYTNLQRNLKLPMQVLISREAKPSSGDGIEYRLMFTTGENSQGGIMGGPLKR